MVVNAVVSIGVVVPVLLTVGVGLLTGCSQLQGNAAATAATARAGYCVGVDTAHPRVPPPSPRSSAAT